MVKINEIKNIIEEVQFMRERWLDYGLVKVFARDRKGLPEENSILENLKEKLQDNIYVEAIYVLTHKIIKNSHQAKELYFQIIAHRDYLAQTLGRNIGIEVAALDYMKNIVRILKEPEIIENSKVYELLEETMVDDKTGAFEHKGLILNLNNEIERAKRYKRPLSLLFVDIDNFKRINDGCGHIVGDLVLKKVVAVIKETIRAIDQVYRYGGDELVCILPETDIGSAKTIAQRIAKKASQIAIGKDINDNDVTVTLSIGITQSGVSGMDKAKVLINEADRAMYRAKKIGKNNIFFDVGKTKKRF